MANPITFPNGSVFYPDQNFFVLGNGMMVPNGPNAQADIQRFSQIPTPKPGGSIFDNPSLAQGASRFPNGSVYFPNGDFYVLANGRTVANTSNVGTFLTQFNAMPPLTDAQGRQLPPGVKPPTAPPPGTPPGRPVITPIPPPGTPVDPRPGSPITKVDGSPVAPTTPTTPPPTPPNNFDKGQVAPNAMPGDYYTPTASRFPGDKAFNPYAGQRGGLTGGLGAPTVYDPLGIGQDNYGGGPYPAGSPGSNQNIYSMTGANAATGYNGPLEEGVVGGQGGYGVGMVAPEYTGPQFDDPRQVVKAMRRQERLLNQPAQAVAATNVASPTPLASGWGFNSPNAAKAAFAAAGGTRDTWRALRGAGADADAAAAATPAAAGAATGGAAPAATAAPAQNLSAAANGGFDWSKYYAQHPSVGGVAQTPGAAAPSYTTPDGRMIMADPNSFTSSKFGDLVLGSGGNNLQYKVNDGGGQYGYTAQGGWEPWNEANAHNYVDPTQQQYSSGAGQLYRTMGGGSLGNDPNGQPVTKAPIPGDTGVYTDLQGKTPYQANQTANWKWS